MAPASLLHPSAMRYERAVAASVTHGATTATWRRTGGHAFSLSRARSSSTPPPWVALAVDASPPWETVAKTFSSLFHDYAPRGNSPASPGAARTPHRAPPSPPLATSHFAELSSLLAIPSLCMPCSSASRMAARVFLAPVRHYCD